MVEKTHAYPSSKDGVESLGSGHDAPGHEHYGSRVTPIIALLTELVGNLGGEFVTYTDDFKAKTWLGWRVDHREYGRFFTMKELVWHRSIAIPICNEVRFWVWEARDIRKRRTMNFWPIS